MLIDKKFIFNWAVPALIALVVFALVRPTMAQIMTPDELSRYVLENDVTVGEETVEGFRQVYYMLNEEKIFVTSGKDNSRNPAVNKEYMVWVTEVNGGGGQIFLYHIPTGITTAITGSSTNLNPRVSDSGAVVWEKWLDEKWQIFMYDGISVKQLTDGDVSVNADVSGDQVVFVRQDEEKNWRTVKLDLSVRRAEVIAEGVEYKTPSFFEGNVVYDFGAGIKGDREAKKLREQRILDQQRQVEERLRREEENQIRLEEQRLLDEELARQKSADALLEEALLEESLIDTAIQIIGNIIKNIADIFVEEPIVPAEEDTAPSSTEMIVETSPVVTEEVTAEIPVPAEEIIVPIENILPADIQTIEENIQPEEIIPSEPVVIEPISNEPIPSEPVAEIEPIPNEPVPSELVTESVSEVILEDNTEYFSEVGPPETVTEEDIVAELAETPVIIEEIIPESATETAETAEAVITETVLE